MAVSSRLRYEIMRRDGFACIYCGARPPAAVLHVDHVMPIALGGTDTAENLATACEQCNQGKSATGPEQATVAEVDERALRWRAAVTKAAEETLVEPEHVTRTLHRVHALFGTWYNVNAAEDAAIRKLLDAGLPEDAIVDSAGIAGSSFHVPVDRAFAYFMGICQRKLTDIHARAKEIMDEDQA
jgi:hypothetical protein